MSLIKVLLILSGLTALALAVNPAWYIGLPLFLLWFLLLGKVVIDFYSRVKR